MLNKNDKPSVRLTKTERELKIRNERGDIINDTPERQRFIINWTT